MKRQTKPNHPQNKVETFRDLIETLLSLRTSLEMERFLGDICTPKEISDLADRWLVAQLLDEGQLSYRAIYTKTGVSVTTIGRVARFLQHENFGGYRLALERRRSKKQAKGRR